MPIVKIARYWVWQCNKEIDTGLSLTKLAESSGIPGIPLCPFLNTGNILKILMKLNDEKIKSLHYKFALINNR